MKLFQITLAAAAATLSLSVLQPVYAQLPGTAPDIEASALANGNDIVMYNEDSHIYHALTCAHAKKCKHCVKIKRSDAKAKGGQPCKTCKGGE